MYSNNLITGYTVQKSQNISTMDIISLLKHTLNI